MLYDDLMKMKKEDIVELLIREVNPVLDGTSETINALRSLNISHSQENFILLCLDSNNNIIKTKVLFKGKVNSTSVDLKILFREIIITRKCRSFIVAHNHPSGQLKASISDKQITKKIEEAAKLLDLRFLDHVIFSELSFFSFLEEGLI